MIAVAQHFAERGDLAHLALFLWASSSSVLLLWSLKELAAASRRFDAFLRELARFNARHGDEPSDTRRRAAGVAARHPEPAPHPRTDP